MSVNWISLLWTKPDIWRRLWKRVIDNFLHFMAQTTNRSIDNENNHSCQPNWVYVMKYIVILPDGKFSHDGPRSGFLREADWRRYHVFQATMGVRNSNKYYSNNNSSSLMVAVTMAGLIHYRVCWPLVCVNLFKHAFIHKYALCKFVAWFVIWPWPWQTVNRQIKKSVYSSALS